MKKISIVIPVYFNESNLPDTIPQLLSLEEKLAEYSLELVFVDDGSGDRSLDVLRDYQSRSPERIKVVKLTRNFGSMSAIQAGFTVATGDCVGMISADLQDPPEIFLDMISHWEKGSKAVFAVRQDREEHLVQKMLSNTYYSLIRKFALADYPNGGFDFFLVDRQVAADLNRIQEKNTNIMTLVYWLGYKPVMIPYIRRQRTKGKSRWTLAKKVKLFIDTFVAFSFVPIRILSALGLLVAVGSFIYGGYVLFYWYFYGIEVKGYVPIVVALAFNSGLQMAMLGVLGEYLWRTLDEVRRRPQFVIDEIYQEPQQADSEK
ncbi:MAG: glycosyltransferase [Anaerolineae bacterium]|nr:glycosyltransferase [Anaerolineae bacterium]MBL8105942.1 glycosyltransferase [Anaerolineales bacterium]MCC7188593.1 glycosyltransferase [Anaerolineales bacterium]